MMLAHPARCAAGAAGIDQAGQIAAPDRCNACLGLGACSSRIAADQVVPVMEGQCAGLHPPQRRHADDVFDVGRSQCCGQQGLGQFGGRNDDRPRARIFQNVVMIAFGVGNIGRHRYQPGGHDRQVGDAPFGPVFRHQRHPVARIQADRAQRPCQQTDLIGNRGPIERSPDTVTLGCKHRVRPALLRTVKKHRHQIGVAVKIGQLHEKVRSSVIILSAIS